MERITKLFFVIVRDISYRLKLKKVYYWAGLNAFKLRAINVLPDRFYCSMYRLGMKMVRKKRCIKTANWMIHRVPITIRCNLA